MKKITKSNDLLIELRTLLAISPDKLISDIESVQLLYNNLSDYVLFYKLDKKIICKACGWSLAKYYRNMKPGANLKLSDLIAIVRLVDKKKR